MQQMDLSFRSHLSYTMLLLCFFSFSISTEASGALANGNIKIKWDVLSWTPDGYVAVVTIFNNQIHRNIKPPGWHLRWGWVKKEVIWTIIGARTIGRSDCSRFKENIPSFCDKNPTVVDLSPRTPHREKIEHCCTGGVLKPNDFSSFQLSVGSAGNQNTTVRVPKNFTLTASDHPSYTCGPAVIVRPTRFTSPDGRRVTRALMTWNVTCVYSNFH